MTYALCLFYYFMSVIEYFIIIFWVNNTNMKIPILLLLIFVSVFMRVSGQNVGIGTATPVDGALLELKSNTRALRIPIADTAAINVLGSDSAFITLQPTDAKPYYHNGTRWVSLEAPRPTLYKVGSSAAITTTGTMQDIPGLSISITVPTGGAKIMANSFGSFVGGGSGGFASLNFAFYINGNLWRGLAGAVGSTDGGYVDAFTYNPGATQNVGQYSLADIIELPAGTYTFTVRTSRRAGNMFPAVGGDAASAFQCSFTAIMYPNN